METNQREVVKFTVTFNWEDDPDYVDDQIKSFHRLTCGIEDFPYAVVTEFDVNDQPFAARVLIGEYFEVGICEAFDSLEEAKNFCEITLGLK
jgi:hypothetical protein